MSYGGTLALQRAVYDLLRDDAALGALVGTAIHEAPPAGEAPGLWVSLGGERVRDRSSVGGAGARHDVTVSVISEDGGFARAKAAAAAVSDALDGARPALDRGRVTDMSFASARARGRGRTRRIDMVFRILWDDEA